VSALGVPHSKQKALDALNEKKFVEGLTQREKDLVLLFLEAMVANEGETDQTMRKALKAIELLGGSNEVVDRFLDRHFNSKRYSEDTIRTAKKAVKVPDGVEECLRNLKSYFEFESLDKRGAEFIKSNKGSGITIDQLDPRYLDYLPLTILAITEQSDKTALFSIIERCQHTKWIMKVMAHIF